MNEHLLCPTCLAAVRQAEQENKTTRAVTKKQRQKDYLKVYSVRKRKADPQYKQAQYLRNSLYTAVIKSLGPTSMLRIFGCSSPTLLQHVFDQFEGTDMNWQNYRKTWVLGFKVPLSQFDLTDPEQLKKAGHYTNVTLSPKRGLAD